MRDELSFRSLKFKTDNLEEKPEDRLDSKKNSSINASLNNHLSEETISKKDKVKAKIKEYFENKNQLIKTEFDSFLTYIGLKDIWSTKEEQKFLWESIENKAKNKEYIDHNAALESIIEFFEDEQEDDLLDIKVKDIESIFNDNNNINNSSLMNEENNENCIDEYLNSIKDNIKLIFGIKFINKIFLNKYINNNNRFSDIKDINEVENGINNDLNNNSHKNIEEEKESIQKNDKLNKELVINMNDILNEINTKYRFIMINNEELNNYFNNLVKNHTYGSRKSITSFCIIIKNDKSQQYCIDKELFIYVNTMLKINVDSKTKVENENKLKDNNDINKIEINHEQIIKRLKILDDALSDIFEIITDTNADLELKNLLKIFNSTYIIQQKNYLYFKLDQIIKDNNNKTTDLKETELQLNINEINNTSNNKSKIIMVPDDEKCYLEQQINNLKERNEYLLKENEELKKNLQKDKNEIVLKNSNIKINKLNIPKYNTNYSGSSNINSKNYISSRDEENFRNKTIGDENSIFNMLNQKNNINNKHCNTNRNPMINLNLNKLNKGSNNSNSNLSNDTSNTNNGKSSNTGNKTNSLLDYAGEEFTNSKVDLFSVNGNNNIKENFLLETTGLGIEANTPTLTQRSYIFDNKEDYFCLGDEHNLRLGSKISAINSYRENCNNNSNIKYSNDSNNKMINFNKKKKMSFGINNEIFNDKSATNNPELKTNKYKYDFKYLSLNKKITKLLLHNNEYLNSYEIFSDQINYILNGEKKQKGILLITSQCFYILDDSTEINCILRISHQLLSSLSIIKNNFNHLLISFNEGSFIIIEIFTRMHLLNYLKDLYDEYNYKKININFCDSFNIKLKNNLVYIYELKNRKDILLTPNFENAQKIGILLKYQENFFSAYFDEKIVVLTSIGLIIFDKNIFNKPQLIVPIIGSGIKSITANYKKKLYCFKIKTINNESFTFGSSKNKEINDWIKELKKYKDLYESRMNSIISDFVVTIK